MKSRLAGFLKGVLIVAAAGTLFAGVAAADGDGEGLYKTKCAMCHGPDATGKTPMGQKLKVADLRSDEVQKKTDADLATIITKGKDKMPAYEGKLSKEQIDKLIGYLREIAKKH